MVLLNLCLSLVVSFAFVWFVRSLIQGDGGAAKKVKMEDDASKIDWKDAVQQGKVSIFRYTKVAVAVSMHYSWALLFRGS